MVSETDFKAIAEVDSKESQHPDLETLLKHERSLQAVERPMQPISADCKTTFKAKRISGTRPITQIWWIIEHCTQGPTARSAASWFNDPASQGSAHLAVDDYECYRCMSNTEIPWGAPGANYHGFHIEMAGYISFTKFIWSRIHRRTLMRAAYKTALHCKAFKIPVRWLSAADLKTHKKGISDHRTCTAAFGGDHTDPGPNFPRALFMGMVRTYYAGMTVKHAVKRKK